jgi:hypothetical protein
MDAAGCLTRLEDDIENKANLTDGNRAIMREAAEHLQRAIETPGWSEWMRYAISLPIHIPSLPLALRDAWSESMKRDSEWIDVHSATRIRDKNDNGSTVEDLIEAGERMLDRKKEEAAAELNKSTEAAERKQQKLEKRGLVVAQSNAAQAPNKVSPRKKGPTKKDKIEEALAQAARNAQLAIDVEARAHLPRPLPSTAEVKTRSHKMNYIVKTILSSLTDDKFIIFGDTAELGHCTEVLDLFDISSYVFSMRFAQADALASMRVQRSPESSEKRLWTSSGIQTSKSAYWNQRLGLVGCKCHHYSKDQTHD